MKNHSNLSYMMIRGWNVRYSEIVKEFGFNKNQDYESAFLLDSMIREPVPIEKIKGIINGKDVFVVGAGPSLASSIDILKKFKKNPKIVADSAVHILIKNGITPDIVVTDLDGNEQALKKIGKTKTVMIVHAHGDNITKLHLVENFKNVLGTTQGKPFNKLFNFGGFTDGDRCVFLAHAFNAKKIILFGMDFENKIGFFSNTKKTDLRIKRKKLRWAKILLEWVAKKSNCKFYTTSKAIKGVKKIRFKYLVYIILFYRFFIYLL